MKTALTILEGKWFPQSHVSIREMFNPLFTVWTSNPGLSQHYEQFTNEDAFKAAINHAFKAYQANTIYIGAHGDRNTIHGFHDEGISRAYIRNSIRQAEGSSRRGFYFGSCNFISANNARFLLESPRVAWVAGYETEVDWIDSTALDIFFLKCFLFPSPGRGRTMPRSTNDRLAFASRHINQDMGPFARRLGFHVFVRRNGNGGIKDLIS